MIKRIIIIVSIIVVIFGGTFAFDAIRSHRVAQFMRSHQPPPVTVSSTRATAETWQPSLRAVGTLIAINSVNVSSEVAGQVRKIYFHSGQFVSKGTPLIDLDDDLDQQELKTNLAQLKLDQLTHDRQLRLYRQRATAKSTLDQAQAKLLQSQAAVASAKVRIQKKHISAPFSGKLGIRNVDIGEYLNAGQEIAPLQSMDPLFVDFTLPEQTLPKLYSDQPISISIAAYPANLIYGKIIAVNSTVDQSTRNIMVRALVPNSNGKLYPGVFAYVRVILPQKKSVVTIPQTAISYSLYGDMVYVLKAKQGKGKNKQQVYIAKQRFIVIGERRGNKVAIQKGLQPGEMIVAAGQLKLRNNSDVVINNQIQVD